MGPSGNVGIGTTSPSTSALLHVVDDVIIGGSVGNFDNSAEYMSIQARSDVWYVGVQNEITVGGTDFFIGKSSLEDGTFHIENGGDIGIGTTNPASKITYNRRR